MKKLVLLFTLMLVASASFAQNFDPKFLVRVGARGTLENEINSNRHFVKDSVYIITGRVFVRNGATLTIDAGTVIFGDTEGIYKGVLVITKEGKIMANGTASDPIIFTSPKLKGTRKTGDWGGVVLIGKSAVNATGGELDYDGGILKRQDPNKAGDSKGGGGTTPDLSHSSGTMSYCRIEYPGYPLALNQEINGLTFLGTGSGTVIDHIQVSYSGDDSYEWFGGNVNCKYMVAVAGVDDDWDTDNGFSGNVQFGVSLRSPKVSDQSGSTGFESDNDAAGSTNAPQTSANFCNMTVIGAAKDTSFNFTGTKFTRGAHLRRNTALGIFNSIIAGYPTGVTFDGTLVVGNLANNTGGPVVKNNWIIGNKKTAEAVSAGTITFDPIAYVSNTTNANTVKPVNSDMQINDSAWSLFNPNWQPKSGSPLLSGASFSDSRISGSWFTKVNYVGAFDGSTNWMAKWTNFTPNNNNYLPYSLRVGINEIPSIMDNVLIYPNPAASQATMKFYMPAAKNLSVSVYDITGKEVMVLANNVFNYGENQINISTASLQNGLYFINVKAENGVSNTFKLSVVK